LLQLRLITLGESLILGQYLDLVLSKHSGLLFAVIALPKLRSTALDLSQPRRPAMSNRLLNGLIVATIFSPWFGYGQTTIVSLLLLAFQTLEWGSSSPSQTLIVKPGVAWTATDNVINQHFA
jgi:hypothetical protein